MQEKCAMKVTTDACIQGSWTPIKADVNRVLDIGTGTGLLSLMLAQRSGRIIIDAIELDNYAAGEARENVSRSPWADRITVFGGDVRSYLLPHKYDLIISNPPFFNDSLLGPHANENIAHHTLSLSYSELLRVMLMHLEEGGYFSIMLPAAEYDQWLKMANARQVFETNRLSVKHKRHAVAKRVVGLFCKKEISIVKNDELIIMDDGNRYSQDFTDLLSPFYLNL